MSRSIARSLVFTGVLAVFAAGCSVKGLQNYTFDGGADAGGRDGGKRDVRAPDAAAGQSSAGNSGAAGSSGGVGGIITSLPGGAGMTVTSSQAGTTTSTGGRGGTSASSRSVDAGAFDAYRADTRDAAGGTGGSSAKLDAYRPDTRDAPLGGSGGSSASGGSGGTSSTGSRDAWIPDAPLPDAYLPDAPIDAYVGGSGGSGGAGGTGGASSLPAPVIHSFNVASSAQQGTDITASAGQSITFLWDVTGATTKEIDQGVGMVTGTLKTFTLPSNIATETTITYRLSVTNSVNDASSDYDEAHAEVRVTVVPLAITSFTANPTAITPPESSTLTAFFIGTEATIDGTAVTSGEEVDVSPTEPTVYTLTVKNRLNDSITATVTVNVLGLDAGAP